MKLELSQTEIDIDIMNRTPFFIRPYHVREEDNEKIMLFRNIKGRFSAYSGPISGKVTQDKRVVTDFRHLNTRIAKNNLAYPFVKDTFTMLGSTESEVLSVLDVKVAFHSLRLSENSKKILWYLTILWKYLIFLSNNAHGTQCFSSN